MIQSFSAVTRRLRLRRRYLLIIALALVIIFSVFVFRDSIPPGWVERVKTGLPAVPTRVAQLLWPGAPQEVQEEFGPPTLGTTPQAVASGMTAGQTSTAIPEATAINTIGPAGITTVITMTPTGNSGEVVQPEKTATPTAPAAVDVSATTSADPSLADSIVPTVTAATTAAESQALAVTLTPYPTASPDAEPHTRARIAADLQDLTQILQASDLMAQTILGGQPTAEELAVMKAQLLVINQRMGKLASGLALVAPGAEGFGPDGSIPAWQTREQIVQMQKVTGVLQHILSDPSAGSTSLASAQVLLEQMTGMVMQLAVQPERGSTSGGEYPDPAATPTIIPSPTQASTPTAAPVREITPDDMLNHMEATLRQMMEMIAQMAALLAPG